MGLFNPVTNAELEEVKGEMRRIDDKVNSYLKSLCNLRDDINAEAAVRSREISEVETTLSTLAECVGFRWIVNRFEGWVKFKK